MSKGPAGKRQQQQQQVGQEIGPPAWTLGQDEFCSIVSTTVQTNTHTLKEYCSVWQVNRFPPPPPASHWALLLAALCPVSYVFHWKNQANCLHR